jgi:transposase-like protein
MQDLVGDVEVDESYFGPRRVKGKSSKRGRGTSFKKVVFGIYERNGCVYTRIIQNCKKRTLHAVMTRKIALSSTIYSDSWKGYNGLVDVGFDKHFRINHKKNEFSRSGVHVNGIESFWAYTKWRLTKFKGVKKNFVLHLKECEWRWKKSADVQYQELLKFVTNLSKCQSRAYCIWQQTQSSNIVCKPR